MDLALNHATIASCLSDEYNNLRAVEEIHVRGNQIAIAYARGVAVIFNLDSKEVQKIFYSRNNLQIEALDWFDKTQVYIGTDLVSTSMVKFTIRIQRRSDLSMES